MSLPKERRIGSHVYPGARGPRFGGLIPLLLYPYYVLGKPSNRFTFQGKSYRYFYHRYNYTWLNERCVEIPIVRERLDKAPPNRTLEVGNVLSHYLPVEHDIIDKYESAPGVISEDVVSFQPDKRYDLIVSISTLEHVGWDEERRQPTKSIDAIANLKSLLAPGGHILFTVPVGYNSELDRAIAAHALGLTQISFLKRVPLVNAWRQVEWDSVANSTYSSFSLSANALAIATYDERI
jgi:SAM-dependent methyltransferase